MLTLIMAGGEGSRLNLGEKPLVSVGGRPMIARVIDAFDSYGCSIVVVTTSKTPMTRNWCRIMGIDMIPTEGTGYIGDMVHAVSELGETNPLFVSVCDIPCLHAGVIGTIHTAYRECGKDACSTWVPLVLVHNQEGVRYAGQVDGVAACPAGINILRGDIIRKPQEEYRFLLAEPRLAHNVNSRTDLAYVNAFFSKTGN
ncbi:MAG TPA: NTP transferase domain-containing protein [Methanoregulaceae archaeon]|nr:NTP transferase domain-containing protein [Methanoregulaceae archaeon]